MNSPPDNRLKIAVEGYVYGYPLVLMAETKDGLLRSCGSEECSNTLVHTRDLRVPGEEGVVRPNRDTLYSIAFLDLDAEPVVLDLPPEPERYVVFGLLDAYTNNFSGLGTPSHGTAGGKYVITGPNWVGDVSDFPTGAVRVNSPTNLVWMIGRTEVYGPADVTKVNTIQDTYSLEPLNGPKQTPECVAVEQAVTPPEVVAAMSTSEFFSRLDLLMTQNPPPPADAEMVAKLAHIGVGPGADSRKLRLEGIPTELSEFPEASNGGSLLSLPQTLRGIQNGVEQWTPQPSSMPIGDYGTNYRARFLIARVGFGALRPEFAWYQNAAEDRFQRVFDGSKRSYTITYPKGQLPPVTGFSSISVYNSAGYFQEHPSGKYTIVTHSGLVSNDDGSTTVHLSTTQPTGVAESNWLPVPNQVFTLTNRYYGPQPDILDGTWKSPSVDIKGRSSFK